MPEAATAPAPATTEAAPEPGKTPFSAAFDKAFQEAAAAPEKPPEDAKPEAKPAPVKEPESPKTGTPKQLFKKKDALKPDESKPDEPKSAFDAIAEPAHKDEKGRANWEAQRAEGKTWERKALDLERQIAEQKAAGRDPETLETRLADLNAKLKEYDGIVTRARLEDHPDFRREFVEGRDKLISRAQQIIEESGGDKDAIATALNLKGKARVDALREAAGELDGFQTSRLARVIEELTDLDSRGDAKRANAQKSYNDALETARQREAETGAKRMQDRKVLFDETSRRLSGELEVLKKVDGHDDWNATGSKILSEAREYCAEHPDADPEAEILARSIPAYRDLFLQADDRAEKAESKAEKLEAELKAIHSKHPSLGGSRSADGGNGSSTTRRPGERSRGFTDGIASGLGGES